MRDQRARCRPSSSRHRHASPRHAQPALARDEARPPSRVTSDHRMPPCEKEAPAFTFLARPMRKSHVAAADGCTGILAFSI
ncbi:hypothetical protein F511_18898 [Dorcoceras hygrometricum]|uniref:Uncharacterized protein n=1 Tax=Dorcoceras hygrometricum TaxID=472368 RepID=A0A2Z7C9Y1_9LAMI|nr:hypothetical protein F511_18898 [Dorcoceras hygrometricum]